MRDFGHMVKYVVLSGVVTAVMAGSTNFCLHHNVSYEKDGKRVFQKIDGIMSYTRLEINEEGSVKITRCSFPESSFYIDNNGDGIVDIVSKYVLRDGNPNGLHEEVFHRADDLKKHFQLFKKADMDFLAQMHRFKPYLKR